MILIADGGSTKTNWCLLNPEQKRIYFNTEGYNPYFSDTDYIIQSLRKNLPADLALQEVKEVYYYGSGCSVEDKVAIVVKAMETVFPAAKVEVHHDLLAAARALLGITTGFAAILGTGMNTCLYDGKDITLNISSLGYFLGDEGSGSYIGKRVLRDYMRGFMPGDLAEVFYQTYGLTGEDILDHLYNKPLPNRFCASFSKFIYDHNHYTEYTRDVVGEAFRAFFHNVVSRYPDFQKHSLNCVGSVGYNFRDILAEVSEEFGMKVGKIIRSPIDDLVHYHVALAPQS